MLVRRNPNVPYVWIPDFDPAIDQEAWDPAAKARYFSLAGEVDYTLPPIKAGDVPVRVYLSPLTHEDFLRVQAMEDQKRSACWEDEEIREVILKACVRDIKGVFEEAVNPDGTVGFVELPRDRLFGADGKINAEGLSFFHNAKMAAPGAAVAWGISHSRFTARPT